MGEADVLPVLTKISERRPELIKQLVNGAGEPKSMKTGLDVEPQVRTEVSFMQGVMADNTRSAGKMPQNSAAEPELLTPPVLQFASSHYYVDESEGELILDVMRIGNQTARSEIYYYTEDSTGKAGVNYESTQGKVVFEPGEIEKSVVVPLCENSRWDTNLEFLVKLKEEGIENGVLGKYLWTARVSIIDDDTFPSPAFKDDIVSGRADSIPKLWLTWEYIKMNFFGDPDIYRGSIRMVMIGVFENLFLALKFLTNLYILDFVLQTKYPEHKILFVKDRKKFLMYSMPLLMVMFAFLHYLNYTKFTWRVAGRSRRILQGGILGSFLNYNDESREKIDEGNIAMAIIYDVPNLVNNGYMSVIQFIEAIGKLLVTLAFQIWVPRLVGKKPTFMGVAPSISLPIVTCIFMYFRSGRVAHLLRTAEDKEAILVNHISQSITKYRLIADYGKQSEVVGRFEKMVTQYNSAAIATCQVLENDTQFVHWLTLLLVSLYTIIGGLAVIEGHLDFGMFVTNIGVFNAAGAAGTKVGTVLLAMQQTVPSMDRLVLFLNLSGDLFQRKALAEHRHAKTSEMRQALARQGHPNVTDMLPIVVHQVDFTYPGQAPIQIMGVKLNQGHICAIVGPRGEGKSTLLKIVAGMNLPSLGSSESVFFIPSHLRMLYVSCHAYFFRGTLLHNLTYGVQPDHSDGNLSRIIKICERLGLAGDIIESLNSDEEHDWLKKLSTAQASLVCLARALIANPEVVCLDKPTAPLNEVDSHRFLDILQDFVRERGLEHERNDSAIRRPRTVIFTSARLLGVQYADVCYYVNRKEGAKIIPKESVTQDMLA
eukprot:TRINITY_DN42788_c0_g1_i1.p1 TRINITY_DN42788_c0_g1~~TRINITY_DN42788_c0_g1_i1.p1  ORF type:complete len:891 (+),score=99.72 TRINITY_DN42788_c0_g1_i1:203-2674(+)